MRGVVDCWREEESGTKGLGRDGAKRGLRRPRDFETPPLNIRAGLDFGQNR